MKQHSWEKPNSFTETVRLVENFVEQEIIRETARKQLYYHTLDHANSVKQRAIRIFQAIESVAVNRPSINSDRLENLIQLSALSHDMIQKFSLADKHSIPRKRVPGVSEAATVEKLFEYIKHLNQALSIELDESILFNELDLAIIEDAILATVCKLDPQAGKTVYSFSSHSIYQPYLYNSQPKISIAGNIIALADLGTLGMDGIEPYIQEGILVFVEDNLDIKNFILNCDCPNPSIQKAIKDRLMKMARFIVNLARERKARFELEIAEFCPKARRILREDVFIHLTQENIAKIELIVPTNENVSLTELIDFFGSHSNLQSR